MLFLFDWWPSHRYVNLACVLLSPAPIVHCSDGHVTSQGFDWIQVLSTDESVNSSKVFIIPGCDWLGVSLEWFCAFPLFLAVNTHTNCVSLPSASLSVSSISSYGLQAFVISSHFYCEYLPRVSGPCGCPDQSHTYWATFAWKNCFRFYPFFFMNLLWRSSSSSSSPPEEACLCPFS